VLNPEEESDDEEAPPSPIPHRAPAPAEPVPPLAARPPLAYKWTEWEQGPEEMGLDAPLRTVKQWRFRQVVGRWRHMIQVRLAGDYTMTEVVHCGVLRAVRTKQCGAQDWWTVELDHEETHGWTPRDIKFHFDKEENALAFHISLLAQLG
jgi:hypothetical protein